MTRMVLGPWWLGPCAEMTLPASIGSQESRSRLKRFTKVSWPAGSSCVLCPVPLMVFLVPTCSSGLTNGFWCSTHLVNPNPSLSRPSFCASLVSPRKGADVLVKITVCVFRIGICCLLESWPFLLVLRLLRDDPCPITESLWATFLLPLFSPRFGADGKFLVSSVRAGCCWVAAAAVVSVSASVSASSVSASELGSVH